MKTLNAIEDRLHDLAALLVAHEEGQDMVEYSLLAALISVAAIAAVILIGPYVQSVYASILQALAGT